MKLLLSLFAIVAIDVLATAPAGAQATSDGDQLPIEIVPITPHSSGVKSVAFAPDGARVLSADDDGGIKIWDGATGRLLRTIFADRSSFALSPDGRRVLSGSFDNTMKLWDAATGRLLRTFGTSKPGRSQRLGRLTDAENLDNVSWANAVAFSHDGSRVLSGNGDSTLKLWDAASGRLLGTFGQPTARNVSAADITSVVFSRDDTRILAGDSDKSVKLWDSGTARLIRTFKASGYVNAVALSPDGARAVAGTVDKTMQLWDVATGRLLRTFKDTESVQSVAFSPDGARVLSGNADKAIKLWDAATGQLLVSYDGHTDAVNAVAFSSDGRRILSGSADNTIKLWETAGRLLQTFGGRSSAVASVAFSPDGKLVLSGGGDKTLRLWDAAAGRLLRSFEGHSEKVNSVQFSPDGTRALSASDDKTMRIWDIASGRTLRTFAGNPQPITVAAFSPDGARVLSGFDLDVAKLWDTATGRMLRTFKSSAPGVAQDVTAVAFSPDGGRALIGYNYNMVRLWNLANGQIVQTFVGGIVETQASSAAFSPDGKRVLATIDVTRLFDAASGRLLQTLTGGSKSKVAHVSAYSSDGARIAIGTDNNVELWDAATGKLQRTLQGHAGDVGSVAFSPDGARVLSGSGDSTIRLWKTATGELLVSLLTAPDGEWLAITPEGFFDASEKGAGILSVVRGFEVHSIDQVYQSLYRPDLVREKLAGDPQEKVKEAAARLDLTKVIASGAAPHVAIAAPRGGQSIADDQVTVEATVADQGGGIGRLEWRINGTTLGVDERGLSPEPPNAGGAGRPTLAARRTLSLEPGENRIEVVAYNAKGLIASEPARVAVKWDGEKTSKQPRLHVLAVGVDDYFDSRLRLAYAAADAKALAAAMAKAGAGLYGGTEVTTVLDADVTAENLDRVFTRLGHEVRPYDVFVLFVAGHGRTKDGRYHFLPSNFRYDDEESFARQGIDQNRFQAWLARISARKSILLYDTCESGTVAAEGPAPRGLGPVEEQASAIERLKRATGRTVLAASTDDKPALEGYRGHGVFSYAVLDAVAKADLNRNGTIEVTELIAYLQDQVPQISYRAFKYRQLPQAKFVGVDFPLLKPTDVLADGGGPAAPDIPANPTHVTVAPAAVFAHAAAEGAPIQTLAPGTVVTLVKSEQGWMLVAKDGKMLGYVAASGLVRMQ